MILIEVNAIRRSGHHAFINWLISNIHDVPYSANLCKWKYSYAKGNKDILWINEGEQETNNIISYISEHHHKVDIVLVSYEAPTDDTIKNPNYSILTDKLREEWNVEEHIQIPFVRDFYNNFASVSKLGYMDYLFTDNEEFATNSVLDRYIHLYKHQAKRALNTFRGVIYDKWVSDEEYANEVCIKLIGKPNKYHPLDIGGTSSSFSSNDTISINSTNEDRQSKINSILNRYKKIQWPQWVLNKINNDYELLNIIKRVDPSDKELTIKIKI